MAWQILATQGPTGATGPQGPTGATGADGSDGSDGAFGGATFEYQFNTATSGDPTSGKIGFENANLSTATELRIDDEDVNGSNIEAFLRTIDDSTSSIKGHIRICNKTDASDFSVFSIGGANVEETGYHTVTVAYVAGATSFSNDETIIITFTRSGNKGDTGQGVPAGGSEDMVLQKASGTDYDTEWVAGDFGHTIQDEGSNLTKRSNLSFNGEMVEASDNSGNTTTEVTIDAKTTWLYGG